ncbi:hamartin protein domain-containing protein [Ditylenchus destructor]|uniref:Hamartin protein domain-containing protein n=1 Tax=Ditylenchus destructor TaxID=166010 RepID=A0AAD4N9X5_9BILA|nr:hamartin protein domain-containing protein [Ditylenchus destructor]
MDVSVISKHISAMESLDSGTSDGAIFALKNWISEGVAIAELVEYYAHCQSIRALELLCLVQEPHDNILLDKMSECMGQNPQGTFVLLGRLVQKSPSWIPKVPHHHIFRMILAFVQPNSNMENVIAALLFITAILPYGSTMTETLFSDVFNCLIEACRIVGNASDNTDFHSFGKTRAQSFEKTNETSSMKTNPSMARKISPTSHVNIRDQLLLNTTKFSLMKFFQSFYGIFPCSLVHALREFYNSNASKSSDYLWSILEQLFFTVRLHPALFSENRSRELSNFRWTCNEIHDFFAMAQKLSTNPIDSEIGESLFADVDKNSCGEDGDSEISSSDNELADNLDGFFSSNEPGASRHVNRSKFGGRGPINIMLGTPPPAHSIPIGSTRQEAVSDMPASADISQQVGLALVPHTSSCRRKPKPSLPHRIVKMFTSSKEFTNMIEIEQEPEDDTDERPNSNNLIEEITGVVDDQVSPQSVESAEECIACSWGSTKSQNKEMNSVKHFHVEQQNTGREMDFTEMKPCCSHFRPEVSCSKNQASVVSVTDHHLTEKKTKGTAKATIAEKHLKVGDRLSRKTSSLSHLEKLGILSNGQAISLVEQTQAREQRPCLSRTETSDWSQRRFENTRKTSDHTKVKQRVRKTEQCRKKYMKTSAKHHMDLKSLGLANRVPGKMYDDMARMLEGLSLEKQSELLSTRLRLVNQHLLFERYCRLLHETRNRRLFAQLKLEKSYLAECERLKRSEHQCFVELDEQAQQCKKLKQDLVKKEKYLADNELKFNETLSSVISEKDKLSTELTQLREKCEDFAKSVKDLKGQLDQSKRQTEELLIERKHIDQQLKELDQLRNELARSLREKQFIEEEFNQMNDLSSKANGAVSSNGQTDDSIVTYYETQLKSLRTMSRKSKTLLNQANEKIKLMENQWKEELDRRLELQSMLERASLMNSQISETNQQKFNSLLAICTKQEALIFNLYRAIESHQPFHIESSQRSSTLVASTSGTSHGQAQPISIQPNRVEAETISCCDNSFVFTEDHASIADLFSGSENQIEPTSTNHNTAQMRRSAFLHANSTSQSTNSHTKDDHSSPSSLPDDPKCSKAYNR